MLNTIDVRFELRRVRCGLPTIRELRDQTYRSQGEFA
jgi:hypothetical protein